jgi:hypothetical protein
MQAAKLFPSMQINEFKSLRTWCNRNKHVGLRNRRVGVRVPPFSPIFDRFCVRKGHAKAIAHTQAWRTPLNGRQLVLKTRVVLGLGVRFLCPPLSHAHTVCLRGRERKGDRLSFPDLSNKKTWEVGEAGAHMPLKTARRRFDPVTSHAP